MRDFLAYQPELSEHQICNNIVDALNYAGHYVWRTNAGRLPLEYTDKHGKTRKRMVIVGKAGTSDIIGIHGKSGRFIALEVKTPARRNQTTPAQEEFLEMVRSHHGIAGVATDIEEALRIVKEEYAN